MAEAGAPTDVGAARRAHPARQHRLASLAWASLLAVASLAWFAQSLDRGIDLRDEGYLLHVASRVADGEIPHRDFAELYGPAAFALPALALESGGGRILAVRWLIALFKTCAVLLCYVVLRRLVPLPLALAGGGLAILFWGRASANLNTPLASLFSIPICLLGLWRVMRALERGTARDYFVAGLAAGCGLLFKQSLAVMNACGLVLAIGAVSMLFNAPEPQATRPRTGRRAALAASLLFLGAGAAILLPAARFLNGRDYLLHFLPLHLWMAVIALAVVRNGLAATTASRVWRRLLPFAAGVFGVFAGLAGVYASLGALPALVDDMFVLPLQLRNYYLPAFVPPAGLAILVAGCLLALTGTLRLAVGRGRSGLAWISLGLIAIATAVLGFPHANPDLYTWGVLWRATGAFDWVLSSVLLLAAIALFAPVIFRADDAADRRELRDLLPVIFFQALLAFQIFPRAGSNVWIIQGACVPLGIVMLRRAYRLAVPTEANRTRRIAAAVLLACIPAWLVAPATATLLSPAAAESLRHPLAPPETRGITVSLQQISQERLADFEALLAHLARSEPADAPLLLFSNQQMIYFLSGREPLQPEREYLLFLAATGMLPLRELVTLADGSLLERLALRPETLVVEHRDPSASRLRKALPAVAAWIDAHYETDAEIGVYRVLRSRAIGGEPRGPSQNASP